MAAADEDKLLKMWEGLGYYNRARNLQKAAITVVQEYDGRFPETYEEILSLAGIGDYTAGAIGSICFQLPTPAVDGNVLRVYTRVMEDSSNIGSISVRILRNLYTEPDGTRGDGMRAKRHAKM